MATHIVKEGRRTKTSITRFSQAQACGTHCPQSREGWTGDTVEPHQAHDQFNFLFYFTIVNKCCFLRDCPFYEKPK